ncbi:MAG: LysR family transcriptional regulator [Eubacteriales bacterium]|nr:LysR family transcriptional regulator [Eubacteriales bacterium]
MIQHLNNYKVFYEVAKYENLSHASKILFISQPAVSKSINILEKDLGVKLFTRSVKGVDLTNEGKLLFEHIQAAFNQIDDAEKKLSTFSSIAFGHLRISSTQTMCSHLLISYISEYTKLYPNMRLSVNTMPTSKSYEKLENKSIDLALVNKQEILPKNIEFLQVYTLHDCFVCSRDYFDYYNHVFNYSSDYFTNGNIMLLDKYHDTRTIVDNYFSKNNIFPTQILEASSMDLIIEFAKASVGIGSVIREFVQEELDKGELIEIKLKNQMEKRKIGFAYNKSNKPKAVIDFLKLANK